MTEHLSPEARVDNAIGDLQVAAHLAVRGQLDPARADDVARRLRELGPDMLLTRDERLLEKAASSLSKLSVRIKAGNWRRVRAKAGGRAPVHVPSQRELVARFDGLALDRMMARGSSSLNGSSDEWEQAQNERLAQDQANGEQSRRER
jgi:hypothetical protein